MSVDRDRLVETASRLVGVPSFTGDEEAFAFARALSRLTEMGSKEWVERGMGVQSTGSSAEQHAGWEKMRSEWKEETTS